MFGSFIYWSSRHLLDHDDCLCGLAVHLMAILPQTPAKILGYRTGVGLILISSTKIMATSLSVVKIQIYRLIDRIYNKVV